MSKIRLLRKALVAIKCFDEAISNLKEEDDEVDEKEGSNFNAMLLAAVSAIKSIPSAVKVAATAAAVATTAYVTTKSISKPEVKTTPIEKMETYTTRIPDYIDTSGLQGKFNVKADTLSRYQSKQELINSKFDQHGVPRAMSLITVIETNAGKYGKSNKGAMGPWQFMPATGREWGLKDDADFYDWEKSTDAAARYIKYLHKRMNNWYLAVMAYNCGPGNVNIALRKAGISTTKSFYTDEEVWNAWQYVPLETKNYLLRFLDVSGQIEVTEADNKSFFTEYTFSENNAYNEKR